MLTARSLLVSCLLVTSGFAQDDLNGWITELKKSRDDAEPELIRKVANVRTREAMDGLLSVYELVTSIYMRREIIRSLAKFDGVKDAEQPAVEKLANVAASSEDVELRDAAIKSMGNCRNLGKHFLAQIVDSDASDDVREKALRSHVRQANEKDVEWYREIWNVKRERRKDEEGNIKAFELDAIRELAFEGLSRQLTDDELIYAMRNELDPKIRRASLVELHRRSSSKAKEMAKWLFERVDKPGPDRARAAEIYAELEGPKVVSSFVKVAKKWDDQTPSDLRKKMADLIVAMNDEGANKTVSKLLGKGKPHEKVFALMATRHLNNPKILKKVRKGLKDRDVLVRKAAAKVLGERRDKESLPDLEKMLARPREPEDIRIAVQTIGQIQRTGRKWLKRLVQYASHTDRDTRNAALEQLAKAKRSAHLDTFLQALKHDDWTTRLAALHALERLRSKNTIPTLIERLGIETGRMSKRVAEVLWNLTAMPFDEDQNRWSTWWEHEGEKFEVVTEKKLEEAEKKRELRRLSQRTRTAKFFGIKIESHRVIFIIDTSGSMTDAVWGRFIGKRGATRIDIAKQELTQCIENLEKGALFNILSFSSGIGYWMKEGGIASSREHTREQALEWVDRLGAGGATNLYDTIKVAFEDRDVDTIFILSDGEPTAGEVRDANQIREDVKFWNRHRKIKINTIAIGGNLEVLEWIAEDSGGDHVRIR